MKVLLVDPEHPVLPASFLEAVLGRGEPVEVDAGLPFDVERWGVGTSTSAVWFLTADPQRASARGGELVDARPGPVSTAVSVMRAAVERGEWERAQTHESLIPYLREESEEFIDSLATGDDTEIVKELGDVLLQVLFHAEIAARQGRFDIGDVAASFVAKMRSRSPYLFDGSTGTVDSGEQERLWQAGKRRERGGA